MSVTLQVAPTCQCHILSILLNTWHSSCHAEKMTPTTDVLELANNTAKDNKETHIISSHVLLAICNDEELDRLMSGITTSQSTSPLRYWSPVGGAA
jgi:hypothetical protein